MIKDVEPLLKECEETLKELMKMGDMEAACYVQGFINSINKLPDAEQRQHGRWSEIDLDNFRKYKVVCPFCGMEYIDNYDGYVDVNDFNFCPNCGASMLANDRQVIGKLKQPCPCDTCQTRIDRCGCQMHLCSDYQKWKEGEAE